MDITKLLHKKIKEKKVIIAVHRGSSGGNIIENTIKSFEIALKYGGDMIEVDAAKSTDGEIYTVHQGQEERLFFSKNNVETLNSHEINLLDYRNGNSFKVNQRCREVRRRYSIF